MNISLLSKRDSIGGSPVLQDSRYLGPMSWVMAILMFITVLATATGLAVGNAAYTLSADVSHRLTVQIVEANPDLRHAQTSGVASALKAIDGIEAINVVEDAKVDQLLAPWLGNNGAEAGLPYPSIIDISVRNDPNINIQALQSRIRAITPSVRIEPDSLWLNPLAQALRLLTSLAVIVVVLMMVAVTAAVILSARAAFNTHQSTIAILHMMGSSDRQISKLFQRRIAADSFVSAAVGLIAGVILLIVVQALTSALQSEFVGATYLQWWAWLVLALLPLMAAGVANLAARQTVMRALRDVL